MIAGKESKHENEDKEHEDSDDYITEMNQDNKTEEEDDDYDLDDNENDIDAANLSFNENNPNNDSQNSILRGKWTLAEDELLRKAVQEFGGKNWRKISSRIEGRTDVQCLHRWQKVLRPGLVKGPWTKEVHIQ